MFRAMTLYTAVFILLVCSAAGMAVEPQSRNLVLIDTTDAAILELLERSRIPVYFRADHQVLAGVDDAGLAAFEPDTATVLDRHPWSDGKIYYQVIRFGQDDISLSKVPGIEVIHREGYTALIKAVPADAEQLPGMGFEITKVDPVHKPLASTTESAASLDGPRDFGGVIDEMVPLLTQLRYRSSIQTLENFGTRYTYTTECDDAADWIYFALDGTGLDSVERHEFPISTYTKENIIGTKTGLVYPDEVIFITAHYDSTSNDPNNSAPGADDNASGTAAVIETARILAQYNFERTIMFACFAGEEQGLYGSMAYAADIAAQGMNVLGCYNYDMVAWSGSDPAPPDLVIYTDTTSTALADRLSDAILYYVPTQVEPVIVNEAMTASDHAAFWQYGFQAILGIEATISGGDFNPYYHSTEDLVSNCDLAYATACSKGLLAAVAEHAGPLDPTDAYLIVNDAAVDDDNTGASSGNGNGIVEPGEIIELTLTLENIGIADANGVSGLLDTASPYITITADLRTYGSIPIGGTAVSAGPYVFEAGMDIPDGYSIPFTLAVSEDPSSIPFSLDAEAPELLYDWHTADDSAGDGDGIVEAGETVVLPVDLENHGAVDASGISATLSTATPGVTVVDGTADWPAIAAGATATSLSPHFTVSFSGGMTAGTVVDFDLDITADEGISSDSFIITLSEVALFYDDMESGPGGWTHVQVAEQDDWMLGYPGPNANDPDAPYSGSNLWGNDLAPSGWNGDYYPNVHNYLRTPDVDCSGFQTVTLRYMRWLTVEEAQYDQATIYVNGNQIWQNEVSGHHLDTEWTQHEIDISAWAADNAAVWVEFHMESDGGLEYGGWNIDDFAIVAIDESGGPPEDTVSATMSCEPASGTVPFSTSMWVTMNNLYSGQTRRVAGTLDVDLAGGQHYSNWKSGWSNIAAGGSVPVNWNQSIPAVASVIGDNIFSLMVEDVTPAPFNQPPHPPEGDTDTDACTVTAYAP